MCWFTQCCIFQSSQELKFNWSCDLVVIMQEDKYKEYKREKRRERKRKARADDDIDEEGGVDPEMAAMMGFSGFGTKKKAT